LILSTDSGDDGVGDAVATFEVESNDADTFAKNVVVDLIIRAVDGYGGGTSHNDGC
jgi:hypothetical protein